MSATTAPVAESRQEVRLQPDQADAVLQTLQNESLAPFQDELLDLAYDTASAIPAYPHIKTRSQRQEDVFDACLELNQPARASRVLKGIDDWRRGAAYGDLALDLIQRGSREQVPPLLDEAAKIAATADQDWRRDTVLAKIARAKVWLGELDDARKIEAGLEVSQQGAVALAQAGQVNEETFNQQLNELASAVATKQFDVVKNSMGVYTKLFKTYFKDTQKRTEVENKLRAIWGGMPLFMRIDALLNLGEFCARQGEPALGLQYVDEAQKLIDGATWPPDYYVPLLGRGAAARGRCGDAPGARREAGRALAAFTEEQAGIESFDQAGALRPAAEAYQIVGDKDQALQVYRQVIAVGAVNPNARCRAEDLTATCLSMALHAVAPDTDLWQRMRQIRAGLGNPW